MKDAERTNRDTPAALDAIPERYWRNARFLSRTDQEKLLQAHVVIIGLGGLGGTVLEELLRLGIGTITGVDMDVFELSLHPCDGKTGLRIDVRSVPGC